MKKKLLTILLAACAATSLCFGLAACGGCTNNGNEQGNEQGGNTGNEQGNTGGEEISNSETHVHSGEWIITKEATCMEDGSRYRICTECGETETQVIQKKDHSFNSENICTVCGYELQTTVGLEYEEYEEDRYPYNTYFAVTGMGIATDRDIVIPAYYMGKAVKKISASAFSGKDAISSVYIPNGIIEIGSKAFYYCTSIEKITLPASIEKIGNEAFAYCSKLSEVELPEKGMTIGAKAFYNTAYYNTTKNWQNGVLYCGNHLIATNELFQSESYTVPQGVLSIASSAFANQIILQEIVIESSPTVGENIFTNTNLIKASVSRSYLECLPAEKITDLTVNDTIYDLHKFINLKNLTVGSFYSSRNYLPLQGLGKLENLTVGSLTGYRLGELFGSESYSGATSVSQKSATYNSKTGSYTLSSTADSYYIPSSLCNITVLSGKVTPCAFYGCKMLNSLTYGKEVTMGYYAIYECDNLQYFNYLGNLEDFCSVQKEVAFNCTRFDSYGAVYSFATIKLNGEILQGEITIPETITEIIDRTFLGQTKITKINIPDSVTSIGNQAFGYCTSLTSITIPDSVTSIGNSAFVDCYSLTSITIPDSVTSIGNSAFVDCTSLTSVTISDSVTSIGSYAFYGCTCEIKWGDNPTITKIGDYTFAGYKGTNIPIPDSVTSIGSSSFYNCTSLESVTIPDSVTSIGDCAFKYCTSLTSITIPDSVTSIGNQAFWYCTSLTSVTIPNGVTSIGNQAFGYCTSLTSVTIPNGVTSIGNSAFYNCTALTSVTIGSGVTSVGDYAFDGCTSLESINIPDGVTCIGSSAFYNTAYYNNESNWENGVLYIGKHLIKADTSLSGAYEIKSDTLTIVGSAFRGCTSLTSITIPDSVTSIGNSAFYGCTSLKSVTIGSGVTSIGSYAFYGCSGLTSVTIPKSVTSIGSHAFYNCTALTEINYNATECENFSDGSSIYYNYVFYNAGQNGEGITVTIGANVKKIPAYLFCPYSNNTNDSPKIVSVVFAENSVCESIGSNAFYNCTSLTGVYITDIASWCSISFGDGSANPLYYAHNLYLNNKLITELTIPDDVTSIGASAFYNCSSLTSITIPDSVTSIGNYAFNGCTGLTSVTIGNSVTSIGYGAFYNCTKLTSVTIGNSVTSIGSYAFYGCTGLTGITIPDSVTSIGDYAFYGCTELTSVTFENTSGWWRSWSSTATSGTSMDVSTPATNATNLKSTYYSYYWKRS